MAGLPRLPACQQCYQRKVKCDSQRPRCEVCTKNDSECVFANPETGEVISRQELAQLEETIRQLSGDNGQETPKSQEGRTASPEHEEAAGSKVAQGSGLGFMSPLFSDQEWRESNAYVLRSLANASTTVEPNNEPNDLPSADEAKVLFDSYLSSTHIQNPTLLRRVVLALYDRVFQREDGVSHASRHDLFRTFMVLALGAVQPYRRGRYRCHPFGYYLSAMRHFDRFVVRDGLDPIQDLLLISRFGIYHHIGTSVWAITRLCVRMCVEQGLHRQSDIMPTEGLLEEQLRRRVFWVCYMMDRYSSITLNRPFAISDDDIEVGMVADVDDEYLDEVTLQNPRGVNLPRFDDLTSASTPSPATEMSAFISCVRLRQISSRIHRYFADTLHAATATATLPSRTTTGRDETFLATGHIHVALQRFLDELERWRASAPLYDAPQCLFERTEWYDLQRAREAFNLLRRVLDVAPKRDGGAPPRSLLAKCQASAVAVIQLYSDMYERSIATYTRSYFQMMFTAGLSLLYCGSVLARAEASQPELALGSESESGLGSGSGSGPYIGECSRALERCRTTLTQMTADLPDARHYVAVFEALFRHISRTLNQVLQRAPPDTSQRSLTGSINTESNGLTQHVGYQVPPYTEPNYLRDGAVDPMYAMSIPAVMDDGSSYLSAEGLSVIDSSMWNWDVLNDEALWNVGQYVVGDPSADFGIYDPT